ncbi:LLM class flavin-dependent oxidoreductase [Nesterenkonia sp. E16_7]|uniref:LLM class flavin-dependent oxidoreductase n=1 Tax=unclassified Nesterenkonia TaxID=2629769 RepID=UPI001A93329B|nr:MULTISPECIES: LLM class flavin-dependent oxidoreductase [unclassified Nesterenkonia]MBO0595312.1 LLM class flavin-dependent oxidoreductase [Nesterenkonia sp. E16_10]MBO0598035.1 LLM class flavin-dependent oxidoreductase [Nesterenkonia sp. E16_7]
MTFPRTESGKREILFNAFDMNCVVHQSPGLWRHPEDRARDYNTIGYWTEVAQILERGLFDGLFIADVLGPYDVFGSNPEAALRSGAQIPLQDPFLLVSAMAAVTKNLGFGITAGTAYEHPYPFSRRLGTLDHLTGGRVGWNVVTGYLPSAAQNMGQDDQMEHDRRYDHADEYLDVVYKLLEGSWEDDAVLADKASGVFTDPAKVHRIEHHGEFFKTPGIGVVEPSPQRTPVIYQAGASSRGRAFAGKHAEAVFINPPTKELAKASVAKIRASVAEAGRDPYSVRIFAMQTIVTGEDDAAAQAKYDDLTQYIDAEGGLVLMSGWMGIDLSQFDLDQPIGDVKSNAIQSTVETFQKASGREDEVWTVRQLAEWVGVGGFGPVIIGDGPSAAQRLIEWQEETDVDGFNLAYHITPGTFLDVVEHVVPELQRLGRYKTEYTPGTLRNKLFGAGDHLPAEHHAAQFQLRRKS